MRKTAWIGWILLSAITVPATLCRPELGVWIAIGTIAGLTPVWRPARAAAALLLVAVFAPWPIVVILEYLLIRPESPWVAFLAKPYFDEGWGAAACWFTLFSLVTIIAGLQTPAMRTHRWPRALFKVTGLIILADFALLLASAFGSLGVFAPLLFIEVKATQVLMLAISAFVMALVLGYTILRRNGWRVWASMLLTALAVPVIPGILFDANRRTEPLLGSTQGMPTGVWLALIRIHYAGQQGLSGRLSTVISLPTRQSAGVITETVEIEGPQLKRMAPTWLARGDTWDGKVHLPPGWKEVPAKDGARRFESTDIGAKWHDCDAPRNSFGAPYWAWGAGGDWMTTCFGVFGLDAQRMFSPGTGSEVRVVAKSHLLLATEPPARRIELSADGTTETWVIPVSPPDFDFSLEDAYRTVMYPFAIRLIPVAEILRDRPILIEAARLTRTRWATVACLAVPMVLVGAFALSTRRARRGSVM